MAPHNSRQFSGKSHKSKGVLSVPASATQKRNPAQVGSMATRIAAPRLKLVIRRLPPALTESEFDTALGEEWKVNGGKVDWMVYKAGKLSTECATLNALRRSWISTDGLPALLSHLSLPASTYT